MVWSEFWLVTKTSVTAHPPSPQMSGFFVCRWSGRVRWAAAGSAPHVKTMRLFKMSSPARHVSWDGGPMMTWQVGETKPLHSKFILFIGHTLTRPFADALHYDPAQLVPLTSAPLPENCSSPWCDLVVVLAAVYRAEGSSQFTGVKSYYCH